VKIMAVDPLSSSCFAPLAASVLIIANQFLLFRVHGNNGFARSQGAFDDAIDMAKLIIAIGMIPSFLGFAVALETVTALPQELGNFGVTGRVMSSREFRRQRTSTLAGPTQGRLWIASRRGLNQTFQDGRESGIIRRQYMSSTPFPANPAGGERRRVQFLNAFGKCDTRETTGAADLGYAAITQFNGFAGGNEASGVFVQMRPHTGKIFDELYIGAHALCYSKSEYGCKVYSFTSP
jgi:hypothetical protein